MKPVPIVVLLCLCAVALVSAAGASSNESAEPEVTMRKPFVLTLHVDKDHYYEENIGAIPYVYENGVYLMKGDRFGVSLEQKDGNLVQVLYQPDFEKADVTFEFRQEVDADKNAMMRLTMRNRTSLRLKMQAMMTVPGHKGTVATSLLPLEPGLTNFESWPHPIAKLLLHDIEIAK
jgi:hypothetical protein